MKNIWTIESKEYDKIEIMEEKRPFYHIKNFRQPNSSPSAPARKSRLQMQSAFSYMELELHQQNLLCMNGTMLYLN